MTMAELSNIMNTGAQMAGKAATSVLNPIGSLIGAAGGSIIGALGSYLTNKQRMKFEQQEAEKQRIWNEQQAEKQNEWNLEQWNRTNEYNTASAQVQRLKDAGLNPMYYGIDGVAAQPTQAAQPLGYDRASVPNIENPLAGVASTFMQAKSLQKDIEMKNAQIDKLKADTTSVGLDNEWKDKTMEARVESEKLANELTKEQKAKIVDERKQIAENIKKTIAETDNEIAKGLLINAQTRVSNAQADEIAALLPYKQMVMEAQTNAQKAAAAASFINAAINQKLLDEGAIDAQIDKAKADARDSQARAAYDEFKASVHNGTLFDVNEGPLAQRVGAHFFNSLFAAVSSLSEALVGPISGILK